MSDAQSLTLPKLTSRSRVKLRRPRRPSGWTIFWACYCVWCASFAIFDAFTGRLGESIFQLAYLGAGWVCLTRRYRAMPARVWKVAFGVGGTAWALQIAGVLP